MTSASPRRAGRRTVGGLLGAAAALALALLPAMPAAAHNFPVAWNPEPDSTVTEQPGTISITTNDDLLDLGNGGIVQVVGPDGLHYGDGCGTVVGASVELEALLGEPGAYEVAWQAVSTDGHPISGEFGFTWAPAAGVELGTGSDADFVCGTSNADEETDASESASDEGAPLVPEEALWIGGAVLAIGAAVGVTLLLTRRKPD
ncbi:copper resistance CopC family protein [Agromyces mangrovi Wang et al. 2018]|uniref:copper resistance CopC family protein n=1 Tax=Agromyces mangrovi TaxID=1858653 RepID=UPI002572A2D5|nr:copper resistance CopC family protein [Agromyces mangrovi]BDZ63995.1 copper resistance protein CopC [Agromyces mangrovi]